jgi:hypothetical protein
MKVKASLAEPTCEHGHCGVRVQHGPILTACSGVEEERTR